MPGRTEVYARVARRRVPPDAAAAERDGAVGMAQVFISYAREDAAAASRLADDLARRGWDVWWDPELIAGQHFDEVIEHELRISGAVVVLWSTHSVESQWVRAEASSAADRNVLVPARLADVDLPLRFINLETADLT